MQLKMNSILPAEQMYYRKYFNDTCNSVYITINIDYRKHNNNAYDSIFKGV